MDAVVEEAWGLMLTVWTMWYDVTKRSAASDLILKVMRIIECVGWLVGKVAAQFPLPAHGNQQTNLSTKLVDRQKIGCGMSWASSA
jgi:hypothetical protein